MVSILICNRYLVYNFKEDLDKISLKSFLADIYRYVYFS